MNFQKYNGFHLAYIFSTETSALFSASYMYANVKIVVLYLKITVSLLLLCRPSVLYVNKATCPPYFSCGLFLVRRVSYYTGNALLCGVELCFSF